MTRSRPPRCAAAEFWALVRNAGVPTAHPHALDADCILAAQVMLLGGPDDVVTVATTNARHLSRLSWSRCLAVGDHHGLTALAADRFKGFWGD